MTTPPVAVHRGAPPHSSLESRSWSPADAADLFNVDGWGLGYFSVSERGTLRVHPERRPDRAVDLLEIVEGLRARDLHAPILIRFPDLTADRMRAIRTAFDDAIGHHGYDGRYACVYPIKVNQQRHVCEEIVHTAGELGFGIEAGSRPELLAALFLTEGRPEMPLVCNGFKDDAFLEMVVLASKLGRRILPVVEQFHELELLIQHARRYGVVPDLGVRVKLVSTGVGRWEGSAGLRGKFGLTVSEILKAMELLRTEGMLDSLRMLHCHIGSQVFDIRNVKNAVGELAHVYAEMVRLGAPMGILDIGGGLGVDYDGSHSATEASINYRIDEYAADVVHRIQTVCDEAGVAHPDIFSESGRALIAYSSVLVTEVLGARSFVDDPDLARIQAAIDDDPDTPQSVLDLLDAYERLEGGDPIEVYHDALHARAEATSLFALGYMSMPLRAATEELFWAVGRTILDRLGDDLPDDLGELPQLLSDLYFCNLSIFQSLPDTWAIDQQFPILPIHRLDEAPTRRGILADITCDSDGKIDRFIDPRVERRFLELHPLRERADGRTEPYYLGVFLVGAYQETLGDLHNLLGDTHAVHVAVADDGGWRIEEVVEGDTVREVLGYVQFDPEEMRRVFRRDVEGAIRDGVLSLSEGRSLRRIFEKGLEAYTYLE